MTISFYERSARAHMALTAALCVAAILLHWTLQPLTGDRAPFMFFLIALALVATLAGRGYALVVLAVGLVNGAMLLPPVSVPTVAEFSDRVVMLTYVVVGSVAVLLGDRLRRTTQRAMEAERSLSIAQEDTGVGLFEIDLRRRSLFASPSLMRLFGHRPRSSDRGETISLDAWNAGMPSEELAEARALLRRHLTAGAQSYEREHRVVLPDGQERWFHSKLHIERDDNGRAVRLRGASVDITERKRTTALLAHVQTDLTQQVADLQRLHVLGGRVIELEDLHAQLHLILQTLMEFDGAQKGLISLSDPVSGRLEIETEIGFGRSFRELAPLIEGSIACGQAHTEKRRVLISDVAGDIAFAPYRTCAAELGFRALHCIPLLDASGAASGVISLYFPASHVPTERELRLTDICARKATIFVERARARAVAQESDQRFRLALESSAVPFSLLAPVRDTAGRIIDFRWTYANSAAGRVLHVEPGVLIGSTIRQVLFGAESATELMGHFAAVAELGEAREFEQYLKAGPVDGWFHVIASPLQGAVAVWAADVTERKRDEHALQEADRRKDAFLATLAHELRNPLAPIRQAVTISKTAGASETQKRWSHDVIERQVQHMALLLDDLLDVSRITRGMLTLRKAPAALGDVVDAAVETVQPLIEARGHRLLLDIPPGIHFEADPLRISQILANLLTNAAKYTDAGGTIRLHVEREIRTHAVYGAEHSPEHGAEHNAEDSVGELCIAVIDNGIGIPPDQLTSIFEMFTQIRSPHDRAGGGLGIGLALAKGLAELHGGRLDAASEGLGRGSRFTLRLPLHIAANAERALCDRDAGTPVSARRILVADDNRDAAETLAEFLRMEGHAVHVVYDGLEALAGIKSFAPEVALLDIGMPGLTGNEVAQRARTTEVGRKTALIAVTGWGQEKDRAEAMASGFGHHLTKPVDLRRLRALLAHL